MTRWTPNTWSGWPARSPRDVTSTALTEAISRSMTTNLSTSRVLLGSSETSIPVDFDRRIGVGQKPRRDALLLARPNVRHHYADAARHDSPKTHPDDHRRSGVRLGI